MVTRQTLLPLLSGVESPTRLIREDQTTQDIMKQILKKHESCSSEYDLIAHYFEGGDTEDICRRLFSFCKKQLRYYEEPVEEQYASSLSTILRRGHADCKAYALIIGGTLAALNRRGYSIYWCFRFATDKLFRYLPSHVFIVVFDQGREIWVDPVLSGFDFHKWYFFTVDRIPRTRGALGSRRRAAGKIGCVGSPSCSCGCGSMTGTRRMVKPTLSGMYKRIGTTQQTGQLISKVSPALAEIPVAGVFLAAAGEIVGLLLQIFGSAYSQSTKVRWLTQTYQYRVLSQGGVTSDNKVSEAYTQPAQKWFYAVLGVPIYDICRVHTLRGEDCNTGQPLGWTDQQAAQQYLQYGEVQKAGVTLQEALQAVSIARMLQYKAGDPPGIWKNLPFSPYLADKLNAQAQLQAQQGQAPAGPGGAPAPAGSIPSWLIPVAAGAALLFLIKK